MKNIISFWGVQNFYDLEAIELVTIKHENCFHMHTGCNKVKSDAISTYFVPSLLFLFLFTPTSRRSHTFPLLPSHKSGFSLFLKTHSFVLVFSSCKNGWVARNTRGFFFATFYNLAIVILDRARRLILEFWDSRSKDRSSIKGVAASLTMGSKLRKRFILGTLNW